MHKKRSVVLAGVAIVLAAVIALAWLQRSLAIPPAPVSAVFIEASQSDDNRVRHAGPTFRLTNHTANPLYFAPWQVELREGTNWTKLDYRNPQALPVLLAAHADGYVTIDFASQLFAEPTNTWRLRLCITEKLVGARAILQAMKHYPASWRWRHSTGNTNIPLPNPFSKGQTWYGNPRFALSDVVQHH